MSSADSKRSKRRRNKRGGGSSRPSSGSNGNAQQQTAPRADGQVMTSIPVPSSLSDLDLDNIPQPLTHMPRSHNPYLDREHCLLCRRERPDPPAHQIPPRVGGEKESNGQLPITQMPLWLCPDCRRTVEEEEANSTKGFDPSAIGELLLPPTLPLITNLQNLDVAFSTSQGVNDGVSAVVTSAAGGGKVGGGGDTPCQCEPCRERREIAAEQEHSRQQLGECWTELSHLVRCVYWEAGTSLTGEESTTKLSLPRMKQLVHRLCAHDPHHLYICLENEVEDFIKEMRERLLKQLAAGFRTPSLAKQFITMLLEEYAALCSASQTLLSILGELEKEHLCKFNLTWPLHNKHLFHSLVYMEPGLHDNLGTLIKQLRAVAMQKEPYHEESYSSLLQRYLQFDNDMSVVGVVWRDCQQLIEDYQDEQELYKGKNALNRTWDAGVSSSKPRPLMCQAAKTANGRNPYQCHSPLIGQFTNGGGTQEGTNNHKNKKKCRCDECRLSRLTTDFFTPDLYEELGLKQGGQLSALDSYLQSINPPDLSSTTSSSECSSQGSNEDVIPIFSRSDLIHSGFSSPRSDDSEDSDDLDSESSPSPSQNDDHPFDDEDEEGEHRVGERRAPRGRTRCRASKDGSRQNSGVDNKKDSNISSNQPCECHVCAANHQSAHLSAATMMTANIGDKVDITTKPSYLFYPGHQPLDLSHHGITAKHPLIHPHLYNIAPQKPNKIANSPAFQLNLDAPDGLHAYSDWNSAYESAKMALHSRSYGHEDAPDLVQSALQSNCRHEKENRAKVASAHHGGHEHGSEGKGEKEDKGRKHSSNVLGEWTKQQRAVHAQHAQDAASGKSKSSGMIAQELCAKHNLPAIPKLPNSNLFFPSLLPQGADVNAAGAGLSTDALAQQFSQGVQQALMTQGMLATHGGGLQLQNAGIHVADVHHLQQQQQQLQQQQQQHHQHANSTNKKKGQSGEETTPAEPTVKIPDYLNEQHLQTCSHQNQVPNSSNVLGTNAGLCNSSMQTAASTPTSASVCSDPDYETPNYPQDDDTPSNYDDKDSNASSTTREKDSKHCECCYCEFFGQGPQPAPTSRNYTEIRDRLRLRLRERKQPKDQSPSHEELAQRPPPDILNSEERSVDDLLSYIEGASKTKSSSKAAKKQRQKQKKAEQQAKKVPDNNHKKEVTVPVSLHHHHHHHHHHHVEVTREKQPDDAQHKTNCKMQQHESRQQQPPTSFSSKQNARLSSEAPKQQAKSSSASKSLPKPPSLSTASSSASKTTVSAASSIMSASAKSSSTVSSAKAAAVSQESQLKAKNESGSNKKGKTEQPQNQHQNHATAPSSNVGNTSKESKAKGKQNGAGKQGPSLTQAMETGTSSKGKSDDAKEMGKANKQDSAASSSKQSQPQSGQQKQMQSPAVQQKQSQKQTQLSQAQKQQQQQQQNQSAQKAKTNKDERHSWKGSAGQEKMVNGNASDSSSSSASSSRSNSLSSKGNNPNKSKQVAPGHNEDGHPKKQMNGKANQPTPATSTQSSKTSAQNPVSRKSSNNTNASNANTSNSKEHSAMQKSSAPSQAPAVKMEISSPKVALSTPKVQSVVAKTESAVTKLGSKRAEVSNSVKVGGHPMQNGLPQEVLQNGLALANGNGTTNKRRKKKKNSDNPNASIDEIFLPKENVDMNEMDETERELEAFKRFCLQSTPQQNKEKVVFNIKDLTLKKSSLQAH